MSSKRLCQMPSVKTSADTMCEVYMLVDLNFGGLFQFLSGYFGALCSLKAVDY